MRGTIKPADVTALACLGISCGTLAAQSGMARLVSLNLPRDLGTERGTIGRSHPTNHHQVEHSLPRDGPSSGFHFS